MHEILPLYTKLTVAAAMVLSAIVCLTRGWTILSLFVPSNSATAEVSYGWWNVCAYDGGQQCSIVQTPGCKISNLKLGIPNCSKYQAGQAFSLLVVILSIMYFVGTCLHARGKIQKRSLSLILASAAICALVAGAVGAAFKDELADGLFYSQLPSGLQVSSAAGWPVYISFLLMVWFVVAAIMSFVEVETPRGNLVQTTSYVQVQSQPAVVYAAPVVVTPTSWGNNNVAYNNSAGQSSWNGAGGGGAGYAYGNTNTGGAYATGGYNPPAPMPYGGGGASRGPPPRPGGGTGNGSGAYGAGARSASPPKPPQRTNTGSKYCQGCGQSSRGQQFCPNCGTRL